MDREAVGAGERTDAIWMIGSREVDPGRNEVRDADGVATSVEPRSMRLLMYLVEHAPRVVSVREILDAVWKDVLVTQDSVYTSIADLRRALDDDGETHRVIVNVPRRGYQLAVPARRREATPPTPAPETPPAPPPAPSPAPSPTPAPGPAPRRARRLAIAVAAAAVVGLVAFIIPRLRGPAPSAPHGAVTPSIAVLPFADLSEHHDQQFLGDGLAVEILDQLQHIPGLRVIGRNSSFRFRGQAQDAPRIGATLGASYLLDGSVRRSLDRVRVNVELLAIGEGAPLWSKTYDVAAVDQFQLQDAIAIGVAHALKLTIAQIELERPRMKPEAYDLYLHALQTMDALSMEGWMRGIATLEDAARLDPDNSRIHGAISIGYGCAMMQGWPSPTEPYAAAMHHADLALKLDSRNAIAHATRGSMILAHDWDRRQGEAEMEEALRLGPKDPWVLFLGANFHAAVGHWARARQLSEALLAIDPLSSHAEFVLGAHILMPQGDYAGAVRHLSRAIQILPEYQTLRFCRAVALLQLGRAADALTEAQSLDPDEGRDVIAAIVLHNLKRKAESDAALVRATSVVGETWPYGVASMHAYRGEADAAMRWLEISYRTHGVDLYLIAGDPLFLPIAQDPRFQALLKRLNLRE